MSRVRIGAHVPAGGDLLPALDRAHRIGAEVIQVFTQSPRAWKPTLYSPEVLEAYRAAAAADPTVQATWCHATYLVNLASPDPALLSRSLDTLVANLSAARGMGAIGLVVHPGSHRGAGIARALAQVARGLCAAIERARDPLGDRDDPTACPLLVENTAGAGHTVGRTFDELAAILAGAGAGGGLGVCLDTAHLWASGVDFSTRAGADEVLAGLEATVGLEALRCLHLNDSAVARGANRDRHANLGSGTIGEQGLAWLLGHPALDGLDALLEVPGDGRGPGAADVIGARRLVELGRSLRGRGTGRPPPRVPERAPRPHGGRPARPARPAAAPTPRAAAAAPSRAAGGRGAGTMRAARQHGREEAR